MSRPTLHHDPRHEDQLSIPASIATVPPERSNARGTAVPVPRPRRRALLGFAIIPALGALAACSNGDPAPNPTATGAGIEVLDPWAKAAETGMTAVFGTIRNSGTTPVHLMSATTPVSTEVQLHETVASSTGGSSMRQKEGGFTIPAGGDLLLEPGGDHIMLMGLTEPLRAGTSIDVTLHLEGGASTTFTAAVRDFAGAKEEYEPGASDGGGMDGGMDMGDGSSPAASDGGEGSR